jgi:peptidoglycan/LPS O-acetylase OafA/YrhL
MKAIKIPAVGESGIEPQGALPLAPKESAYSRLQAAIHLPSIPSLDGIRAIAVFLVILFHIGLARQSSFVPGPLGVLAFFVLSGFLITWLLLKEDDRYGSISLKGFYRRRALRIFPAFYVFWVIAVGLGFLSHGRVLYGSQAVFSFFYVSNYFLALSHSAHTYMVHTWSLSAEEQFYLLWPLCFLLFSKKRKSLMIAVGAMILTIWVHRAHIWTSTHGTDYINYAFDTRADALLVGCMLALALKAGSAKRLFEKLCSAVWSPAVTGLLIGGSAYLSQLSLSYRLVGGLAIDPLLVAILICQVIVHGTAAPWSWLNSEPVKYLGRISYPLYLYHLLAIHFALRIRHINTPLFAMVCIVLVVLMASCSYQFVEKPFLALKRKSPAPASAEVVPLAPSQLADPS